MNTKILLLCASLAAAIFAAPGLQAATEVMDQVVAIVDDDVIMASELRERTAALAETLKSRGIEQPPEDEVIRQTLDRLILESIQLQKGLRAGVRISDAQLNGALQGIASQNGMSLEQFSQAVEQQGQSFAQMREQVRREMIVQRVQAGNVNQRIQITPKEVDNFLATEDGQKLTQPEYNLLHALIPVSPDASASQVEAAQAFSNKLVKKIRGGQPFEKVVRSESGTYTISGGDLGWRSTEDLPSLFSDIAPTLKQGQIADPIRSASGFHLILLKDKRGGEEIVAQTKAGHILVKPSEIMTDDQARELVVNLKTRALGDEEFSELAKEYSEDIGSAQEGGDLGWTSPGQMVAEFQQTMDATAIGQISDPVRTQFGWHIILVEDRREHDMTTEATRKKAMDYLHRRKYQEELDAWLQQIRDEAFVDIK